MTPILIPTGPQISTDAAPAPVVTTSGAEADWDLALMAPMASDDGAELMAPANSEAAEIAPVVQDALQKWLDLQSGLTADLGDDSQADAAMRALAEGLPTLPADGNAELIVEMSEGPVLVEVAPAAAMQADTSSMSMDLTTQADWTVASRMAPGNAVAGLQTGRLGRADASPVAGTMPDGSAASASAVVGDLRTGPATDGSVAASLQGTPTPPAKVAPPDAPRRERVAIPVAEVASPAIPSRAAPLPAAAPISAAADVAVPTLDAAALAPALDQAPDSHILGDTLMSSAATRAGAMAGPAWQPAQVDPRSVLQQVAEAVITTREDRTEIALSPEELGRVRLILSGADRAQITIWAERPETLELLRRNADLLNQQLADAGVGAGSLDFQHEDRGTGPDQGGPGSHDNDDLRLAAQTRIALTPTQLSDRRLDIRI